MTSVAAVILAAGASTRMGRPKLLLPLGNESLIRTMTRRCVEAGLNPVIVVVGGPHENAIRAELRALDVDLVQNPAATGPTSGSLHCGLAAIPLGVGAVMVVLPDMVRVTTAMLTSVRRAGCDSNAPLAVSRYGEVFAPPLFFRRVLFPELLAWHGEGCGKRVVESHQAKAVILDWPPEAIADIDTPEDYQTFRSEITQSMPPIDHPPVIV